MVKYFLTFVTLYWSFNCIENVGSQLRIAGGVRPILPGDVPYHFQIRYLGDYKCGAALIIINGLQVIVTAGSCVSQKTPGTTLLPKEGFVIVGGRLKVNGGHYYEQFRCVSRIVRHADWRRKAVLRHDIAILLLDEDFELNRLVQPIELTPFVKTKPTDDVAISGWGYTSPTSQQNFSPTLKITAIKAVTNAVCNEAYQHTAIGSNIPSETFCVGVPRNPTYQGACKGDEGSPAVATINGTLYLVGVFSFGIGDCGNRYQPSVYTDLTYYNGWIGRVTVVDVGMSRKKREARWDRPYYGLRSSYSLSRRSGIHPRIVGGESAVNGDAPYHVEIRFRQYARCSGALVRDPIHRRQIVLTAAFCVSEATPVHQLTPILRLDALTIIAGRQNQNSNLGQVRTVRRIERHPGWINAVAKKDDIAILILTRFFNENEHVEPIDLPEGEDTYPPVGRLLSVTGWGNTTFAGTQGSAHLQIVEIPVISLQDCHNVYHGRYDYDYSYTSSLCAHDRSGSRGPAKGDNGAPGVARSDKGSRYLAGIFSRTELAAIPNRGHPSIFSRVSYYIPWIKQIVRSLDGPRRCEP